MRFETISEVNQYFESRLPNYNQYLVENFEYPRMADDPCSWWYRISMIRSEYFKYVIELIEKFEHDVNVELLHNGRSVVVFISSGKRLRPFENWISSTTDRLYHYSTTLNMSHSRGKYAVTVTFTKLKDAKVFDEKLLKKYSDHELHWYREFEYPFHKKMSWMVDIIYNDCGDTYRMLLGTQPMSLADLPRGKKTRRIPD